MSFTRRQFLNTLVVGAGTLATSSLAGCRSNKNSAKSPHTEYFPQSVMSGDPTPSSLIFWTRVEDPNNPKKKIRLHHWPLNNKEAAKQTPWLLASQEQDATLKIKLTGLTPGQEYGYQFEYQGTQGQQHLSRIARTKTAPAANADATVKFAFASCQDYSGRYYNSYLSLLNQEPPCDFLLHLGDYIYETTGDPFFQIKQSDRTIAFRDTRNAITLYTSKGETYQAAKSLDNYRQLYQIYRSDSILQKVHEIMPLIAIWDDHEFANDSYTSNATHYNGLENENEQSHKHNAERAYFEYMPIDCPPYITIHADGTSRQARNLNTGTDLYPNTKIYRSLRFGQHLDLFLSDTRSFRQPHLIPAEASMSGTAISHNELKSALLFFSSNFSNPNVLQLLPKNIAAAMQGGAKGGSLMDAVENALQLTDARMLLTTFFSELKGYLSNSTTPDNNAYNLSSAPNSGSSHISQKQQLQIQSTIEKLLQEISTQPESIKNLSRKKLKERLLPKVMTILQDPNLPFYGALKKLLLCTEITLLKELSPALNLEEFGTLRAIFAAITMATSSTSLGSDHLTAERLHQHLDQELKKPQSLGVLILVVKSFIAGVQEKEPALIAQLINEQSFSAQKLLDKLLEQIPKMIFNFNNMNLKTLLPICLPFAALGKTSMINDIGSRYLVIKDSFDFYAHFLWLKKISNNFDINAFANAVTLIESPNNDLTQIAAMLGDKQTDLFNQFSKTSATWKIMASAISTTPVVVDFRNLQKRNHYSNPRLEAAIAQLPELYQQRFYINVDQWDGYPITKQAFMNFLAQHDIVAIAGDVHAALISTSELDNKKPLIDITVPSISSAELGATLDKGLDSIFAQAYQHPEHGAKAKQMTQTLKDHYDILFESASKIGSDKNDNFNKTNILLAKTRVHGYTIAQVNQKGIIFEYHLTPAIDKTKDNSAPFISTRSFYKTFKNYIALEQIRKFYLTYSQQGFDKILSLAPIN